MAPGIVDAAFIARLREEDPLRAARLFDAEFAEAVNVFLSAAAVEAATDYETAERLPEPGAKYVAACDPAGHGEDAFTMSVVKLEGAGAELRVTQVFQKAWDKPRSGLRDLEAVVADCAEPFEGTSWRSESSDSGGASGLRNYRSGRGLPWRRQRSSVQSSS